MRISTKHLLGGVALGVFALVMGVPRASKSEPPRMEDVLDAYRNLKRLGGLTIEYPRDETLFPPDIAAPTFCWADDNTECNIWLVNIEFQGEQEPLGFLAEEPKWTPEPTVWEDIKRRTSRKQAGVTILGVNSSTPKKALSAGRISIKTSAYEVGAPIFYREVNLPFVDAVKDPSHIRWRFGAVSSEQPPPIVLDKMPVCGNCHSFSADAAVLGMDVDYANDKGSYAIVPVEEHMVLDKGKIITWSDYERDQEELTFGLLSQVSPDGRFVVSTVKDESVFVPKPGLDFSQLFFPIKGILCIYDRQTGTFGALPGADDPYLVQSNPTWSPDGEYIVFAAAEAYKLKNVTGPRKVLLTGDECWEFLEGGKPFKFDLYRIPFNGGKGGKAEPLEGASFNDMSNFFPKYSPDGKWIVFCKAENYMLLQPDSKLYIIPAEGGEARELRANTKRMNSWHSFSPNGKWLVFSSKPRSPYTQLFLTHIDEQGHSTPPVVLDRLTAPDRAANIPEFVNTGSSAIKGIRERFVDDLSFVRAAREFIKARDYEGVERQCRKALELNPDNPDAHCNLGLALFHRGELDEAEGHWLQTIRLDPNKVEAYYNLGQAMLCRRKTDDAAVYFSKVVNLKPDHVKAQGNLGGLLLGEGRLDEAIACLSEAIRLDPNNVEARYNLAQAMLRRKKPDEAIRHLSVVVKLKPNDADAHYALGTALARQKKLDQAVSHWLKVADLDPNNADVRYSIGKAMVQQGNLDEAIVHWSEAINLEPNNIAVRYNLGIALAKREQHDQAVAHWLRLLHLKPDNVGALMNIAASYAKTDRLDEALASLQKALDIARSASNEQLVRRIGEQIELYRRNRPLDNARQRDGGK